MNEFDELFQKVAESVSEPSKNAEFKVQIAEATLEESREIDELRRLSMQINIPNVNFLSRT